MLATLYPWIKAFHIMAVISWMAGLFYLPRLYVYQAERGRQAATEPALSFAIMEAKLLRVIMRPAAIASWAAGLVLVLTPGIVDWGSVWPWTKAAGVVGMTAFHLWCEAEHRRLGAGIVRSGRAYRLMNEVPTLLMILIVLSVVVRF